MSLEDGSEHHREAEADTSAVRAAALDRAVDIIQGWVEEAEKSPSYDEQTVRKWLVLVADHGRGFLKTVRDACL